MIIVGRRAGEGIVEFKDRVNNIKEELSLQEAIDRITTLVRNIK